MIEYITGFAVIICIILGLIILHLVSRNRYTKCNKVVSYYDMDTVLTRSLPEYDNKENNYTFVYSKNELPLGRAMAFLNFFGRSIYDEEPYIYLCKRATKDNDFSEYGCIIARTGAYISKEIESGDDDTPSKRKDKSVSFVGLLRIFSLGSIIFISRFSSSGIFNKYQIVFTGDKQTARMLTKIGKTVVANDYGLCLSKNNVVEVVEEDTTPQYNTADDELVRAEIAEQTDLSTRENEARINTAPFEKGVAGTVVGAIRPNQKAFYNETKQYMDGAQGHGYAAEYANNVVDRALGRKTEAVAQKLKDGKQIKNGADRLVDGVQIQTKYCKSARDTIDAAFDNEGARYTYVDEATGKTKMMQIEVPRDQYDEAVKIMQDKIDSGQVPDASFGDKAESYVRKGHFTYEQSYNIAAAGTIDSLKVDALAGAVCCLKAASISSVIVFAISMWNGATPKEAIKESLRTSLLIMGKGTLIYTLTMQLSRKKFAIVLANKQLSKEGVSQGFKTIDNPIYKVSEGLAEKISSSGLATTDLGKKLKLNKTTGRQLIGGTVTVAIVFGPDLVQALFGRISTQQLIKNSVVGASGIAGAVAGQAIIPIPVVGAMIGGAVASVVSKNIMDIFIEDDAKEMFRILKEEFIDQTMLAGLSKEEFDLVVEKTVGNKKIGKKLRDMFQSKDYRSYARESIMKPAISQVLKDRKKISDEDYDHALTELVLAS